MSAFFKAKEPVSNRQKHQLAFVSEFCTDIAHVPGCNNVMADALSRQHDDDSTGIGSGGEPAMVHVVAHMLSDIDLDKMAEDQPETPSVGPPNSLSLQLLRIPGCSRRVWCDTSLSKVRFLVPQSWRTRIFEGIHCLSHPSGKATLAIISRSFVWEGMHRDVLTWAKACQICARSKVSRHTRQPVQPIPVPQNRFEHVHIDVVGPFPRDQGMKYLLTMVDRTTRWPEVVAIEDTTADTILQAFHRVWIARFGIPKVITSDRGAQFTSTAWTASLEKLGVSVSTLTAYHPHCNGLVEQFHHSLKNALRCAIAATTSPSWTRSLPWVMRGLRNARRQRRRLLRCYTGLLYGCPDSALSSQ